MASHSEEVEDNEWVFYRDRDEWDDVVPIEQDEGDAPVVSIAYSEKFKDVHDHFRAILKSSEKSERALELTKDALELNPANYTVWQYRREILKALGSDITTELNYIRDIIFDNPKNYQVWHHRRVIADWAHSGDEELKITEVVLEADAKNYHAWQHRQWALKNFKLFDGELEYVDKLLKIDIRNNSAWNQRYYAVNNTTGFNEETLNSEIEYTIEKIKVAIDNESAWNYLRGLLLHDKNGLSRNAAVTKFCEDLYGSGNRSTFLLALIVDMCEEQCTANGSAGDGIYTLDRAKELCKALATEHDEIREKYWEHVASNIAQKCQQNSES